MCDEARERMFTEDDVPWMTVPKAQREIWRLRSTATAADVKNLDEQEQTLWSMTP